MRDIINIGKLIDLDQYGSESQTKREIVHISELEGKTIIIQNMGEFVSKKYGKKGIKAEILVDGKQKTLFTTAIIVIKQLFDIQSVFIVNKLDFQDIRCKVQKIDGKYFKLIDSEN